MNIETISKLVTLSGSELVDFVQGLLDHTAVVAILGRRAPDGGAALYGLLTPHMAALVSEWQKKLERDAREP